jgi:hypothetical protein
MKLTLALIASALAIYANYGYLRDVMTDKIKPHPYTWFIWSIVSGTVFFGLILKGGGVGAIPVFFAEIFTILIFIFALRHGFRNIKKTDHIFLVLALLGLLPWYFTSDPTISIVIVVIIDLIAFMPTVIKTWEKPRSENPHFYELNIARHILVLASLQSYNIATTFHSAVMIFANMAIPATLYFRKFTKKIVEKGAPIKSKIKSRK